MNNNLQGIARHTISSRFSAYFNMLDKFFLLLLLFLALALGTVLFSIYRNFQNEKLDAFKNEALFVVKLYSKLIEREIRNLTRSVISLSQNPAVVEFGPEGKAVIEQFYTFMRGNNELGLTVMRVDENCRLVYSFPHSSLENTKINCNQVRNAKCDNEFNISSMRESVFGFKALAITVPVRNENGQFKGCLIAALNMTSIAKSYLSELQVRGSGRAWIVDANGELIFSPFYSEKALKVSLMTEIRTSLLDKMKENKDGFDEYNLIEKRKDTRRILCFSKINIAEKNTWFVCLDATPEEIETSLPRFEITEKYFLYPVIGFIFMAAVLILGYRFVAKYYTQLLKEQVLQSQKMEAVGLFVNGLAHDFNNIVQLMSGMAYMLKHNKGQATEYDIKLMDDIARKSFALTSQLVNFSKNVQDQQTNVSINKCILDIVSMLHYIMGRKTVVKTELCSDNPMVTANTSHIEEILMNLCLNSYDAMPNGGFLTIKTELANPTSSSEIFSNRKFVKISVSDTGKGIPKHIQKKIFEPFFTTKGEKGSGLGLSTVAMIVEKLGGEIKVESEEGKGTTFYIFLPCATAELENPKK